MVAQLKERFESDILPSMCEARGYGNRMQAPRMKKIVINMGFSTQMDQDTQGQLMGELAQITGQRPAVTRARVSVSNFRLRQGMPIGAKVTLRGAQMYEFMDRLINAALPRIRDFRGIPAAGFDGRGNFNLGIKEQTIFPEINPDKVKQTQGMDIAFVTSAETDDEARDLLTRFGMPFATEATS